MQKAAEFSHRRAFYPLEWEGWGSACEPVYVTTNHVGTILSEVQIVHFLSELPKLVRPLTLQMLACFFFTHVCCWAFISLLLLFYDINIPKFVALRPSFRGRVVPIQILLLTLNTHRYTHIYTHAHSHTRTLTRALSVSLSHTHIHTFTGWEKVGRILCNHPNLKRQICLAHVARSGMTMDSFQCLSKSRRQESMDIFLWSLPKWPAAQGH